LLRKEPVVSPIIEMKQLEDSVGDLSVSLTSEEVAALEELYTPHANTFIR